MNVLEELFTKGAREAVVRPLDLAASPLEVAAAFKERDHFMFLDSSESGGEQGRYSVLGWEPPLVFRAKGEGEGAGAGDRDRDRVALRANGHWREWRANPLVALDGLLRFAHSNQASDLPYAGGAMGYLSYDLFPFIERYERLHSKDDLELPDAYLAFHDTLLVYDHALAQWSLRGTPFLRGREDISRLFDERSRELDRRVRAQAESIAPRSTTPPMPNMSKDEYLGAVGRALEYIAAGDIYQVNLSQRFCAEIAEHPFELFTRLRRINPSFYGAYLSCEGHVVVSSSPELFLRREGDRIETRPIKGTRRRGSTREEDAELEHELATSEKDAAELAMIVDLERNDLGRTCSFGSVEVAEHRYIERLPTVFHTVSTVRGRLREGVSTMDILRATFPGGSITGCPKIRAIEIIDELEPTRRHVYTGAIGYIGFNEDLCLNIAIRTLVIKGTKVYFQVGGGIVADSSPEDEYEETLHKAAATLRALGEVDSSR